MKTFPLPVGFLLAALFLLQAGPAALQLCSGALRSSKTSSSTPSSSAQLFSPTPPEEQAESVLLPCFKNTMEPLQHALGSQRDDRFYMREEVELSLAEAVNELLRSGPRAETPTESFWLFLERCC